MLSRLSCLQIYNYYDFGQDFGRFFTQYHKILHAVWCSTNIAIGKFTILSMFLTKRLVSIAMFVYQRMSLVKKKNNSPLTVLSEMEENRQKIAPQTSWLEEDLTLNPLSPVSSPSFLFAPNGNERAGDTRNQNGENPVFFRWKSCRKPQTKNKWQVFSHNEKVSPKKSEQLEEFWDFLGIKGINNSDGSDVDFRVGARDDFLRRWSLDEFLCDGGWISEIVGSMIRKPCFWSP